MLKVVCNLNSKVVNIKQLICLCKFNPKILKVSNIFYVNYQILLFKKFEKVIEKSSNAYVFA